MRICLANDSFPPQIDGVSNTIKNYANVLHANGDDVIVTAPTYKWHEDNLFPYPIIRYPSIPLSKKVGFNAGYPFSRHVQQKLVSFEPEIIHSHSPFISLFLCRELRDITNKPTVFTYHTKFDIDIARALKLRLLQDTLIDIMVSNIEAADEVWVVSKGAGDNLKSLGYKGECVVMNNGVDIPKIPADEKILSELRTQYGLTDPNMPVFLSVGRMKWYKGHRYTIEAMKMLKEQGYKFKMLFVGGGSDLPDIEKLVHTSGLDEECIFTGPIFDREILRNIYFLADIFVFPSTYDTNGIVVREAAACNLASIIIKDSCASEGITDLDNGILIKENSFDLARALSFVCDNKARAHEIGVNAGNEIYMSWEDAIMTARKRYEMIIKEGSTYQKPKFKLDDKGIEFIASSYKAFEKLKSYLSDLDD